MIEQNKLIILFDGQCLLCNNFIRIPLKYSKNKFIFISSHSKAGENICSEIGISLNPHKDTIYLIDKKTAQYEIKSEAIIGILKRCNWKFKLLGYFIQIFPKFIRNPIYDFISKNRKTTNNSCKTISYNTEQEIYL